MCVVWVEPPLENDMKKTLILAILAAAYLAGCNTMNGLGKDIEKAGEGLQRASDKKSSS